jgi:DNA polymerase-1
MIAAYLIDSGKRDYDIDILVSEYLGEDVGKVDSILGSGKSKISYKEVPVDIVCVYSGRIASAILALSEIFDAKLQETNCKTLFESIEMPLISVLGDLEWHGVKSMSSFLKSFPLNTVLS